MSLRRLDRSWTPPPGVRAPAFVPDAHGAGIVHMGPGAFFRAFVAPCTDDALAASGGDWRITGISLRGTDLADALNPQDGLYTLIERGGTGESARIVGSVGRIVAESRQPGSSLAALADPRTRIVSLTVTEKAYGIDRATGAIDRTHPDIARDLASPRAPAGVVGLLVEGLRRRRLAGVPPFTVLCCDNLPANGQLLRGGVLSFAAIAAPDIAGWIADHVAFPSTMVDRITPAPTDATRADAARMIGAEDRGAVETEPFWQWVIEDRFAAGRPDWDAAGAIFVRDVAPYERMKLRMLNGAHSMLAYTGFLSGCRHVRDVMQRPAYAALVSRHLLAAAKTLDPLPGIDFAAYGERLMARFRNPALAHETRQIAMDGSQKLPQRALEPAVHALAHGQAIRPFAFAVAAWMRYCLGIDDTGSHYPLRDPREAEIAGVLAGQRDAAAMSAALHSLPGLFSPELANDDRWRSDVERSLGVMLTQGMAAAIDAEAAAAQTA